MALLFRRFIWFSINKSRSLLQSRRISLTMMSVFFVVVCSVILALFGPSRQLPAQHSTTITASQNAQPAEQQPTTSTSIQSTVTNSQPTSTTTINASQQGNSTNSTHINVNGESVTVPQNGSVQKTIQDDGSKSAVDITIDNSSGDTTNASTSVNIFSSTSSSSFSFDQQNNTSTGATQ